MYLSKTRYPKYVKKRFALSRFAGIDTENISSTLPADFAKESFNFCFKNNMLVKGFNIDRMKITEGGLDVVVSPSKTELKRMFVTSFVMDGEMLGFFVFVDCNNLLTTNMVDFLGADWATSSIMYEIEPNGVSYRFGGSDIFLTKTNANTMWTMYGNKVSKIVTTAPLVNSVCTHDERLFIISEDSPVHIRYSKERRFDNWDISLDAGGKIYIGSEMGKIKKLVSFLDYLYIFCDFGVYKLKTSGEQTDFVLSKAFVSTGRIAGDSVACTAEVIIFMTSDGLYSFDGFSVKKVYQNVSGVVTQCKEGFFKAVCLNEKYYCIYKNNFSPSPYFVNEEVDLPNCANTLVVADLKKHQVSFVRGTNILDMGALQCQYANIVAILTQGDKNKFPAMVSDKFTTSCGKVLTKTWVSHNIDFKLPCDDKIIEEVEFKTDSDFDFYITADGVEHCFGVSAAAPIISDIMLRGKEFVFKIISHAEDPHIGTSSVVVGFPDGRG